jgi:oligoendopeptidase F
MSRASPLCTSGLVMTLPVRILQRSAVVATNDGATGAAGVRWNLADLYASPDDPRLRADQEDALKLAQAFAESTRGRVAKLDPKGLADAMAEQETILMLADRGRHYAQLRFAADTSVPAHGALVSACQDRASQVERELLFFRVEWLAVPEERAATILSDPALARYRHPLTVARREKPHILREEEEKILSVKANTGAVALQRLFDEVVAELQGTLRVPGGPVRSVRLEEALSSLYQEDRVLREAGARAVTEAILSRQRTLGFILNTLVQDHSDDDRLRSRPHAMLARHLSNETDSATVDALLAACDRGNVLVARYYRLKRKLLGLEVLRDYDRYAPVGKVLPACGYADAQRVVLAAYRDFAPRMADVAGRFFEQSWIDAELRPGKTGGAFSSATVPDAHPYILLNYTGTLRDVMTLAHEMGHGIHQYLARPQGYLQQSTPLTLAETASVFGEMVTFRRLMAEHSDPAVQLSLLCGKLEDLFATVFRQAAMTRFEQALHASRRAHGELAPDAIGELWMQANAAMFSGSVELTADYRHWWGYISHFVHTPFYCYAYSFGELLVLALFQQFERQGAERFVPAYLRLLEAGGSQSPAALLQPLGVDLNDPRFWDHGLELVDQWVAQAESLAARLGR